MSRSPLGDNYVTPQPSPLYSLLIDTAITDPHRVRQLSVKDR